MKYLYCSFLALLLALVAAPTVSAQDFIYEPVNPNFGGNPFNYSSLLSAATAQDTFKDPAAEQSRAVEDPLALFATNLNRQILSQLTDRFISDQFGRGTVRAGSYTVGGYQIQVTPGSNGVVIVIADPATGNQTTVTIPNLP
ncbi:curli production assembly/transport component CsgF [Hymenobacter terrestris]|uniref:Curli production assembly/transport component CsgF n=1 Tax=Hymenobacter terrestris TaxID=2748310 RepID=A0ABX2Q1C8_9BACT|nr:curli production assembly/transport component CsgF [Hymenobacter terrestris]NVO84743.1 curli assembly protein CsgF [Hymenobacter terrestris]